MINVTTTIPTIVSVLIDNSYLCYSSLCSLSLTSKDYNAKLKKLFLNATRDAHQLASNALIKLEQLHTFTQNFGHQIYALNFKFKFNDFDHLATHAPPQLISLLSAECPETIPVEWSKIDFSDLSANITDILKKCPNLAKLAFSLSEDFPQFITAQDTHKADDFQKIIGKVYNFKEILHLITANNFPLLENLQLTDPRIAASQPINTDEFIFNLKCMSRLHSLSLKWFNLNPKSIFQLSKLHQCQNLKMEFCFRAQADALFLNSFKLLNQTSELFFDVTSYNFSFPEGNLKILQTLRCRKICSMMLLYPTSNPTDEQILLLKDFEKVTLILRPFENIEKRIQKLIPNVLCEITFLNF